jgi:hypothetical protein
MLGRCVLLALAAGCTKPAPPAAPDATAAAPAPPPPAPPPPAVDAAPDARDAASDAGDARAAGPAHKHGGGGGPPAGAGGMAGLQVTGGLPKAEVAKVLRANSHALRACYDRARARNPSLRGRVSFRLTVDGRGRVSLGEVVSSTLGEGDTEMCMVEATRGFKFPVPPGGAEATVSFQMSFAP